MMVVFAWGIQFFLFRWGAGAPPLIREIAPFSGYVPIAISCLIINRINERHRKAVWAANLVCPECGYDLTGNVSGVCPECGNAFKIDRSPAKKNPEFRS